MRTLLRLGFAGLAALAALVGVIVAVPDAGPWLADHGREVVGPTAVAGAEEVFYGGVDAWDGWRHGDDAPEALWEVDPPALGLRVGPGGRIAGPSPRERLLEGTVGDTGDVAMPDGHGAHDASSTRARRDTGALDSGRRGRFGDRDAARHGGTATTDTGNPADPDGTDTADRPDPGFPPADFAPPFRAVATSADGRWSAFPEPLTPDDPPSGLARAMVHPDTSRAYAAVAVVAIDLDRLALRIVPGTVHPRAPAWTAPRPGTVPAADRRDLVAIFNGGWETANGHLGLGIDGEVVLPMNDWGCVLLVYDDDHVAMMDAAAARAEVGVRAFRQMPPCLVRGGVRHPSLADAGSRNWGTALGGGSVVPRSAIGLAGDGRTLFYAKGTSLSAETIATALASAGARDVALLDINGSYPRFYARAPDTPWDAPTLVPLTTTQPDARGAYLDKGAVKDFFYVVRR